MQTRNVLAFIILCFCYTTIHAQHSKKTQHLLDTDLSHFETWIGIPHSTVKGLPKGTYQSDNVRKGKPLGLHNDITHVFTTHVENDTVVLTITGEIYGAITTKQQYSNYHFSTQFKWGCQKWAPRLQKRKDTGILYHCYGAHGRFWNTWKTSLEFQVQETDLGDFISLSANTVHPKIAGPQVDIRGDGTAKKKQYNPKANTYFKGKGYIHAYLEPQSPHGNWNTLEIYTIGNDAVHLVNGKIVMVVENAMNPETQSPLTSGQLQIQSEAAECYYKNMTLTPITAFPDFITQQVSFKN